MDENTIPVTTNENTTPEVVSNPEPVINMDSILDSVKKDLGIMPDYTYFDPDIIMGINSALSILNQLGVGPSEGFAIRDNTSTWSEFIPNDPHLEMVKTYVSKKTKQFFDPPSTGPIAEAHERVLKEMEWRINVAVDPRPGGV